MTCPEEIRIILLKIISEGILRIRISAENGNIEFCRIEANHLHNIPALLQKFSLDLLDFYLNTEVKQYLREAEGRISSEFKTNLKSLQTFRIALSDI